jgi:poly(hydroxyalkanoate) granule-associated protein
MSKKSSDEKVISAEKASEMAKNIWLAGLGAYGKAFDGASEKYDMVNERYEKMSKETTKLFDDLVAKGKKLNLHNQEKISEAKTKTTSSIEDRINKVRSSLHMGGGVSSAEIAHLSEKLDALAEKVDALLDASSVHKKTTKRTSAAA